MTSPLCIHNYSHYLKYVGISENGAITIGEHFTIDGYAMRPIRVITHAHSDHLVGLDESISYSRKIIGTNITLDLVEALGYVKKEQLKYYKAKAQPLEYHEIFEFNGEELELLNADHIPGSAQVVVRLSREKIVIGYTGDFKLTSKTEIIENPNVLIIEATYGNPLYTRSFKDSVGQFLVDIVEEGLRKYKRVSIYAYHGKMQEVMDILRESGIDVPFILPDKVYDATVLLEKKYGFQYAPYFRGRGLEFEVNPEQYGRGVIIFRHFNTARNRQLNGKSLHVILTGRYTLEPFLKVDDYTYVVSLSDHADFQDLIRYVERSSPELVIIDNSRPGEPESLMSALIEKGFCAVTMP